MSPKIRNLLPLLQLHITTTAELTSVWQCLSAYGFKIKTFGVQMTLPQCQGKAKKKGKPPVTSSGHNQKGIELKKRKKFNYVFPSNTHICLVLDFILAPFRTLKSLKVYK